jgi:multicomponent K+:H+ antiporter subunit A
MLNAWLPLIILIVAFTTGMLMLLIKEKSENLRTTVNLSSAAINIVLIFIMLNGVAQGEVFETRLPLLPDINLVFKADALSLMFVSLSGVLWFFTTIYAVGYFRQGKNRSRFFGFFSLCVFSTLGIALAGNLITFLIFYELLTLATYPLIVHKGNEASLRSGKIYLRYTMIGGAMLMVGVVWLKSIAGALDFSANGTLLNTAVIDEFTLSAIFILLLIGLGVKAALFPLHGWLPRAMAAPAPVSSLLHAVAVVKAGAFGIIRVIYDVYGIELSSTLGLLQVLVVLASFTILYGSIRAVFQDDIKKRLAYSTVSQVSYITLGIALAGPMAAIGAVAHLAHQGVMKITMFFCAGNLAESQHIYKVSQLNGIAKKMPITMTAFTIAIFGMIGIPPIAGFVSKWFLGAGAIEAGYPWVIVFLAGSSLLNAIYFLPIIYRAWFLPLPEINEYEEHSKTRKLEANWMMLFPPVVTIAFSVLAGLFAQHNFSPLSWSKLIVDENRIGQLPAKMSVLFDTALMQASNLLGLVILLPFAVALLIWCFRKVEKLYLLLPVCAIFAIYVGVQPSILFQSYPNLFFGSELILDATSRSFLLLSGVLWLLASTYSLFYPNLGDNKPQFFTLFAVAMGSSFGLVLSADMFGFITFFTFMSLASYVLIIQGGLAPARKAANVYIKWVIIGEVAIFSAFCIINYLSFNPSFDNNTLLQFMAIMLVVGFGIKIGLFGFHSWLPLAHPVAVVPASALLSGFMVKAGIIGWMKFFPFELNNVSFYEVGLVTVLLGITGTFYAAIKGILQKDPKAVLAYSTISQMGILSACFGVVLIKPELKTVMLPVIVFYSIHHGLAKSALFLSVGISGLLNPAIKANKALVFICYSVMIVPAIALIGAPLMSGFFAKSALKVLLVDFPELKMAISVSAIFTGLLMCRFIHMIRYKAHHIALDNTQGVTEISTTNHYLPLVLLCVINTLLVLLVPLYLLSMGTTLSIYLTATNVLNGSYPVIICLVIYFVLNKWLLRRLIEINKYLSDALNLQFEKIKQFTQITVKNLSTLIHPAVPQSDHCEQGDNIFQNHWLNAKEYGTKSMNSPSIALLLMVICLLLVVSFFN